MFRIVNQYGGLFIADEVQTGFGRTGRKWFGIEQWEVTPDMITCAKSMGYGVPVGATITTAEIADKALALLEIDQNGLDEMDKRILEAIVVKFGGGPVGVSSLAVAVGEEPDTIEEVYEPYLIMEGYLNRTPQGRVVTELAYKRLGLVARAQNQARLF